MCSVLSSFFGATRMPGGGSSARAAAVLALV
jgi:hypothetical protein